MHLPYFSRLCSAEKRRQSLIIRQLQGLEHLGLARPLRPHRRHQARLDQVRAGEPSRRRLRVQDGQRPLRRVHGAQSWRPRVRAARGHCGGQEQNAHDHIRHAHGPRRLHTIDTLFACTNKENTFTTLYLNTFAQ
jgi:hypothetical protein